MLKNKIRMDCAEIIGYFILKNAKKHMLEFVYDILGEFIDPRMIELLDTDTDSIGMSLACHSLDEAVLPEKRNEWFKTVRERWFPRNMELKEKIPGKFLIEASGTEFVGLNAKTYIIWDEDDEKKKLACKGVMKRINPLGIDDFRRTLLDPSHACETVLNKGFIRTPKGEMFRYDQTRVGLNPLYCKRYVHNDTITTSNLNL
ncbi:MAG: hypothetical protein GY853_02110, partial [PVC group bacterium]|nr:hypothetical protein [PVC group bacterium]